MSNQYKDKEKRKKYLREYRIKNRKKIYQQRKEWLKRTGKIYYDRTKIYKKGNNRKVNKDFFKYSSVISKTSIRRNGINVIRVYNKYDKRCAVCGKNFDLTIHHKDNNGRNNIDKKIKPNNNIDNLVLLCRSCHGKIHSKEGVISKKNKNKQEAHNG